MHLYYIRHAQSENNLLWAQTQSSEGRQADPDITPKGVRQAHHLAEYLSQPLPEESPALDFQNAYGLEITHLYCSLMVRAVATGAIVARTLDLPLHGWTDLHETGGMYNFEEDGETRTGKPGKSRAYFAEHYPELVWPDDADPSGWWQRPFEAMEERTPRAERVLARMLARHGETDDSVALIAHGGFYNHLIRALLALPFDDDYWFTLNNTAITRVDFTLDRTYLTYANHAPHLPPDLIT